MTLMRWDGGGVMSHIVVTRITAISVSIGSSPPSAAALISMGPRPLRISAIELVINHRPSSHQSIAVTAIPITARRCPRVVIRSSKHGHQAIAAVLGIHVIAVLVTELQTAVVPINVNSSTVTPTSAVTITLMLSAIGIAAMVINLALAPVPVLRNPSHVARWPGSFVNPPNGPLPLSIGSLPQVRFVGLANGVVVIEVRFTHDTGGGDSGFSGVPDERRATALARTTTIDPFPSDAETLTRPVPFDPPPTAVPSCDADGGAHDVGADDVANTIGMDTSSLLRNDGINIAPQPSISTSRGRRG